MSDDNRKEVRYTDIGRVESTDLCVLPGVLDDISITGCKVHFPIPVSVDMENDYELKIKLSRKTVLAPLILICHPQWKRMNGTETEIGFHVLRSPDSPQLALYIECLKQDSFDPANVQDILINSNATFIK